MGKKTEYFCPAALRLSVVHQKKGELDDAQHWLSEVLAVPHALNRESSEDVVQVTAEFDQEPAFVQAVQLWFTRHWDTWPTTKCSKLWR